MAVDISALRKFQDLWGPVLESLPAVMDAVAKQADLDRALSAAKRDFDKVMADVQVAKDEAEAIRAKSVEQLEAFSVQMKAAVDAADRRAVEVEEESRARIVRAKEKASAAEAKAEQQKAAVDAAESVAQANIAETEKKHAEVVKAKMAEIAALEKRQVTVENAIEALKSKLG